MSEKLDILEQQRIALQTELDCRKTQAERNRLGQFATPTALAQDILKYAGTLLSRDEDVHFLDPAVGTGSFYSALRKTHPTIRIVEALGYEIDPHYAGPAANLWHDSGLAVRVTDFTHEPPSPRFNLVICNPPYVRHHHFGNADKNRLQLRTQQASGMKVSGLAGLYCYFLGLSHAWMSNNAVAGWLIPSEFMDVNYGRAVKAYLLERVTLLHIHRFDPNDAQFADALVSSAVVWFRKIAPPQEHEITFTFGGTLLKPNMTRTISSRALALEPKWSRFPAADVRTQSEIPTISDFFRIKRGIATGHNQYFILSEEEINARGLPMDAFSPILPSPRYLTEDEVKADNQGNPQLDRPRFLLDTKLSEIDIQSRLPALHAYIEEGKSRGLHQGYLCQHRRLWYIQEDRPPAPIVCTYLGRSDSRSGRPFRFILNNSRATVANVYLAMYPTALLAQEMKHDPGLIRRIWRVLNEISPAHLLGEGRVYGGGLHKLEPKELANVPVPEIAALLSQSVRPPRQGDFLAQLSA